MTDRETQAKARLRRLAPRSAIVAVAGLSAVAVAHASLPMAPKLPEKVFFTSAPSRAVTAPATAAVQDDDEALIAFVEPVPGHAVVSPFGLRQLPWEGAGRLHEGVDISADAGVPAVAAADGVVAEIGVRGGYGRMVAVRHTEGLTTYYAHLAALQPGLKPGMTVKAGQPVGRIGSTGTSTGPHLHFEIRDADDKPLNPAMFLGKAFAEAGDLPLDKAKRYSGRVRMAYVSFIPESKRALMAAKAGEPVVVRRRTNDAEDLAAAERNLQGAIKEAARPENGLRELSIGPDGRPKAQLSL